MCLHACGVATDMVLKQCLQNNASFVICPCCYGGIQNTHLITYPTSKYYQDAGIEYKVCGANSTKNYTTDSREIRDIK